ncbi:MAG: amino acid permease [Holosporaceae bacterium]|nr:amino acid permease [Holosporaceae bacterium]
MGFRSVVAIVFGSQIGSGIFVLPSTLAPYGVYGVLGWIFAGIAAILLAFVFANLCSKYPRTGGPYTYVQEVFGTLPAFFVGWGYWLVSWISTTVVIISCIAYLDPLLSGGLSPQVGLCIEIALLAVVTAINCRSVELAGNFEFLLMFIKFIPFVVVPALVLDHFAVSNFEISSQNAALSSFDMIVNTVSLCIWGFIGVECGTTPAGAVENPSKTIPRAIIIGTCGVALVYIANSAAIMGVIPGKILATSRAPFVDALGIAIGGNQLILKTISFIAFMVCVGTLNAWMLASAQVSLGLAQDKLLPSFFAIKNKAGSPYVSILISSIGSIPILLLTKDENMAKQITDIIDISVKVFVVVYAACGLAFFKISLAERKTWKSLIAALSVIFCLMLVLWDLDLKSTLIVSMFFLSGIFVRPFMRKKIVDSTQLAA